MKKVKKRDSYSVHEILDRTHIIMESVQTALIDHEAIRKDEKKLAEAACAKLFELYQLIGARHL